MWSFHLLPKLSPNYFIFSNHQGWQSSSCQSLKSKPCSHCHTNYWCKIHPWALGGTCDVVVLSGPRSDALHFENNTTTAECILPNIIISGVCWWCDPQNFCQGCKSWSVMHLIVQWKGYIKWAKGPQVWRWQCSSQPTTVSFSWLLQQNSRGDSSMTVYQPSVYWGIVQRTTLSTNKHHFTWITMKM